MVMKAAILKNWMLTTNLSCFPASFKCYLFSQMINLALDAMSLFIFVKVLKGEGPVPVLNVIFDHNYPTKNCNIVCQGALPTLLEITRSINKKSLPYSKLLE